MSLRKHGTTNARVPARPAKPVRITWPGLAPEDTFSADEDPTDQDLFAERDRLVEPIAIYEPSLEAPGEGALSIQPEDLGRVFLHDAVQQMDTEAESPVDFEADELDLAAAATDWDAKTEPDVPALEADYREKTDLDLSLDVIHDASLFDQPAEGEDEEETTRIPHIRADDSTPAHVPERAARRRSH